MEQVRIQMLLSQIYTTVQAKGWIRYTDFRDMGTSERSRVKLDSGETAPLKCNDAAQTRLGSTWRGFTRCRLSVWLTDSLWRKLLTRDQWIPSLLTRVPMSTAGNWFEVCAKIQEMLSDWLAQNFSHHNTPGEPRQLASQQPLVCLSTDKSQMGIHSIAKLCLTITINTVSVRNPPM